MFNSPKSDRTLELQVEKVSLRFSDLLGDVAGVSLHLGAGMFNPARREEGIGEESLRHVSRRGAHAESQDRLPRKCHNVLDAVA